MGYDTEQLYDVYHTEGDKAGTTRDTELTLDEAANLLTLDPQDVEWAIEENGRCDGPDGLVIVEHGDGYPGKWEGLP